MLSASILIHLDFLSILSVGTIKTWSFTLQSLFTWIFYLFPQEEGVMLIVSGFNPYSPGFSIYLN